MRTALAILLLACLSVLCPTAQGAPFTKEVQRACGRDYHKYCGEYGLETMALRTCMDKAGQRLSHACIHALIKAGEVSKSEVERRKKTGR